MQRYASAHTANGEPSFEPPIPKDRPSEAEASSTRDRRERAGDSRKPAREKRVRTLERSSTRELAHFVKTEDASSTEVEVATAILLNRIRKAHDELIAVLF